VLLECRKKGEAREGGDLFKEDRLLLTGGGKLQDRHIATCRLGIFSREVNDAPRKKTKRGGKRKNGKTVVHTMSWEQRGIPRRRRCGGGGRCGAGGPGKEKKEKQEGKGGWAVKRAATVRGG